MGIGATFQIGQAGLKIYQVATEVVSENIANVNTEGYSRQRVILETAPPTNHNGFPLGTGVKISAVERYYDGLLQQQLVNADSASGHDSLKSQVLSQIEPAFNEIANDGIGASITNFFDAWQDLTLNPSGIPERQAVLTQGQILADTFHTVSTSLTDAQSAQDVSLTTVTADVSATLKDIAQLNGQIKTTELVSGNANELRDRRDLLVRNLSEQVGITYTENADGTTDVKALGGQALVTGDTYATMYTSVVAPATTNSVFVTAVGNPPAATNPATDTNITATVGGANNSKGEIGALLELRDTTIPYYLGKVNTLAAQIVSDVNALHVSTGGRPTYDLNGAAGGAFFDAAGTTAASINLDANVLGVGGTSKIAASLTTSRGDNSNALALAKLANTTDATLGATFSSYYDSLVSEVGLAVKSTENQASQSEAFVNQLTNLRESNSGVSLDEELTTLLQYQRSYQASAKLITTATEMLDIALGMVG
jgi:flagellar hook-associated protein 1 FlgK